MVLCCVLVMWILLVFLLCLLCGCSRLRVLCVWFCWIFDMFWWLKIGLEWLVFVFSGLVCVFGWLCWRIVSCLIFVLLLVFCFGLGVLCWLIVEFSWFVFLLGWLLCCGVLVNFILCFWFIVLVCVVFWFLGDFCWCYLLVVGLMGWIVVFCCLVFVGCGWFFLLWGGWMSVCVVSCKVVGSVVCVLFVWWLIVVLCLVVGIRWCWCLVEWGMC